MAQDQNEMQLEINQYIRDNFDYILSLYQKRRFAYLLGEASYILQQLGIVVTKKPSVYTFRKEEGFDKTILYANLYIGTLRVSLKLTDKGEVEAEVSRQ